MHHNLVNRLASIPGVSVGSLVDGLPMTGFMSQDPLLPAIIRIRPTRFLRCGDFSERRPARSTLWEHQWSLAASSPGTRSITPKGSIISENFAREYWGSSRRPLVSRYARTRRGLERNAGVAGDLRHDGAEKKAPSSVYWPIRTQNSMPFMFGIPCRHR